MSAGKRWLVPMQSGLGVVAERDGAWHGRIALPGKETRCVAADPLEPRRLYVGTFGDGLWRSTDGGDEWGPAGEGIGPRAIMSVAVGHARAGAVGVVWAGTEPSRLYRSGDGGDSWIERPALQDVPSRDDWSFPPRPWTHHVSWIEPDPHVAERLFVGIELGGVMRSVDGGDSFEDRKPGSEHDCHTLCTHPRAPERVYEAAGGGYAESVDGGDTWRRYRDGLEHTYAWGIAVDPGNPDTVVLSSADGPSRAYRAASAETYVYRRTGGEPWKRVTVGLPEPTGTRIFAFATRPQEPGRIWACNGYSLYRSEDAGAGWEQLPLRWPDGFEPSGCRGLVVTAED